MFIGHQTGLQVNQQVADCVLSTTLAVTARRFPPVVVPSSCMRWPLLTWWMQSVQFFSAGPAWLALIFASLSFLSCVHAIAYAGIH